MRRRGEFVLSMMLAALLLAQTGSVGRAAPQERDLERAAEALNEALLELDSERLMGLHERFGELAEADDLRARALLGQGLALQASLIAPPFTMSAAPRDEAARRVRLATESLQEALELEPGLEGARPLLAMTAWTLGVIGGDEEQRAAASDLSKATLDEIFEADPDAPTGVIVRIMIQSRLRQVDPAEARQALEESLPRLVKEGEGFAGPALRHWWTVAGHVAWSQFAQATQGAPEALAAAESGLEHVGASVALRTTAARLRKMVGATPEPPRAGLEWTHLADDEAGDGSNESLADAASLSWAHDDREDVVWFRVRLHEPLQGDSFGANVIIDSDDDPETGIPWWGANSEFQWDLLVTAWMQREEDGSYSGRIGASDFASVRRGDFASKLAQEVRFALADDRRTIFIGAPGSLFEDAARIRVVGAAGAHNAWNDDVPNEGAATITLPRRAG